MKTRYLELPNFEKSFVKMEDKKLYKRALSSNNENVRHIAKYALEYINTKC